MQRAIALGLAILLIGCGSTPDPARSSDPVVVPTATVVASTAAGPETTPAPTPAATLTPTGTSSAPMVALVPVVGFWSTRTGLSRAQLDAVLAGTSKLYRRALVAGTLAGATTAAPKSIRAAVNRDPKTLGLLPVDAVTAEVRALSFAGVDLFGNHRIKDLARWPLRVPATTGSAPSTYDPATTWTLVAGGDVMLDRTIYQRTVRQHKGADYPWNGGVADITGRRCCTAAGHPLPIVKRAGQAGAVRALFRDADIALVNLEGPVVSRFHWHPHGLTFTFDPALLTGLKRAGIDVVTIGNNHIGNAGRAGVVETVRHLEDVGIAHVGAGRNLAAARKPAWFDVAGQRIALLGYDAIRSDYHATATKAGSAGLDPDRYRLDIAKARKAGADVVVVLPHWGVEYTAAPTARQRAHARALANAGTTIVLGSHSHWTGAMETIKGRPVFYSLGNFIFDLTRSEETVEGLIVEVTFVGSRPVQIRLHPTVMVDLVQPNLLRLPGDGNVVIDRMRVASKRLTPS